MILSLNPIDMNLNFLDGYDMKQKLKLCPEPCNVGAMIIKEIDIGHELVYVGCIGCGHATSPYRFNPNCFHCYVEAENKAIEEWNDKPWSVDNGVQMFKHLDKLRKGIK